MIKISVYLTTSSASPFGIAFSVGSDLALALLGFLLTCRAYKTKFTSSRLDMTMIKLGPIYSCSF